MKIKKLIKDWLRAIYLEDFVAYLKTIVFRLIRSLGGTDRKIIKDYFDNAQIRKLHIGCDNHILDGWLNSDYFPRLSGILHLDATKTFPFKDNEFEYIFSEHMIEHISYEQGISMLSECFRVLKPNGRLRISTPDLLFLIELYGSDKSELQMEFIKHSTDVHIKYAPSYEDTFVINNYMRAWGHTFIYDEKTLRYLLEKLGFIDIIKLNVCESQDKELQNLENMSRKPPGLLALESLVVEGIKP